MGLSQIACAFYSLESCVGIRYFVDLLATQNGTAHLVIAVPSIIFVGKCTGDIMWFLPASDNVLSAAV